MKKKLKVWNLTDRFKYFIFPGASMVCYVMRLYFSAIISARFDFKYVHYVMDNYKEVQYLDPKHEALQLLTYMESDDTMGQPAFHSKLARKLVNLKNKGSLINDDDTFKSVVHRIMLGVLELESTRQLPVHMKTPQQLYALYKLGVNLAIEPELCMSQKHLNAMMLANILPPKPLDASTLPAECVVNILDYVGQVDLWLKFDTLSVDQRGIFLNKMSSLVKNDQTTLPDIKLGLLTHPDSLLPRLDLDICPDLDEIISFCNTNKIRFSLATNYEDTQVLKVMLKRGLNPGLVHEDEVRLSKLNYFRVKELNFHALQKATSNHSWWQHIHSIADTLTEDEWQEAENLVVADPSKLRLFPENHHSAGMVKAYYQQKKPRTNEFPLEHQAYREIIPYLVNERPKLTIKIVRNHRDKAVEKAFFDEIARLEQLPLFVTKQSLLRNLKQAWLKKCPYSREHLRRADIGQVLTCTTNGDALRFINQYIASREGDRHIELYPEAVREDILLEDLGL